MIERKAKPVHYGDIFLNAMALYGMLKDVPQRTLRRAEMKQGEVVAEPIDYLSDIELKVKRWAPRPSFAEVVMRCAREGMPEVLPDNWKDELGKVFLDSRLDAGGDYRTLYFRAKNQRLHDEIEKVKPSFPEEDLNPEDILND